MPAIISATLCVLATTFIASGMVVWIVARARVVATLFAVMGILVISAVAATVGSSDGHIVGGPLYVAGLVAFPIAAVIYPAPNLRNPVDLLALLTVVTAGTLGAIYQGDVAGLMGMCVAVTLFAYIWWRIETSSEDELLALLWFAFASGAAGLAGGLAALAMPNTAGGALSVVGWLVVPVFMAIGLIRPTLVDVRSLIVGAILNVSAGFVVISVFVGVASALQLIRGHVPSVGAMAVVAVFCAAGFQSTRIILRGVIDRMLFGDRPDPLQAASLVGDSISDDPVLALRAIREALVLPYAALIGGGKELAASGTPVTHTRTIPLRLGQDAVGEIIIGLRAGELALNKRDESVLRIVAPALAQTIHANALAVDLQSSRGEAIVAIADERRRLRRDLHDGLGPTLTGVAYAADAARNVMGKDPAAADALLAGLRADTATAIGEIRRLVEGLRPPALDELGLVEAVRQQAVRMHTVGGVPLVVAIDAPEPMPEISAAAEVAAFRIAIEAITNIVRHTQNSRIDVHFDVSQGSLQLEVRDHGVESTTWKPGAGMSSMRERAEEVGGAMSFHSTPTGGIVSASIPTSAHAAEPEV